MANLIIKSSADNLVLQGSDASPAITVGATGTTTFAENATLSGTANNLGTVTAGTLNGVTGMLRSTASAAGRNVWSSTFSSEFTTTNTTATDTGLALTVGAISGATDFFVMFNESRKEQHWSTTSGKHLYSIDDGSNWVNLGDTVGEWDSTNHNGSITNLYHQATGFYFLSIANGSTLKFKVQGFRYGSSNGYNLNYNTTNSSITAIKITQ